MNTARLQTEPYAPDVVRSVHSTPDGLVRAEPGAVLIFTPDQDEENDNDEDENEDENKDEA